MRPLTVPNEQVTQLWNLALHPDSLHPDSNRRQMTHALAVASSPAAEPSCALVEPRSVHCSPVPAYSTQQHSSHAPEPQRDQLLHSTPLS